MASDIATTHSLVRGGKGEQFDPLPRLAEQIRALTYGKMIEFALGLMEPEPGPGKIFDEDVDAEQFAAVIYKWAQSQNDG